ncbi:MAG: PHP domain-containing protein, partial [Candidatus Micrarchaeaceae archaeon]
MKKIMHANNLNTANAAHLGMHALIRKDFCENITDAVYSKADTHIHSSYSDGTSSPQEIVDAAAGKLQVIAITDHNRIKGAFKAKEYALKNKIKLDIIIGEEISTKNGHVIGLFLKNKIIPGKTAAETIDKIHENGGIAVAPHPFFFIHYNENGYEPISKLLMQLDFDAIEVINNSNNFSLISNARA